MKILKSKRIREEEQFLLTQCTWDFLKETELEKVPFIKKEIYNGTIAALAMKNFAESQFRKSCSKMGLCYEDVKDVFLKQNEQFFKMLKIINCFGIAIVAEDYEGKFCIKLCKNLLVPECYNNILDIIELIKKWSPEEQAEAMQLLAGKKIKITVEDI